MHDGEEHITIGALMEDVYALFRSRDDYEDVSEAEHDLSPASSTPRRWYRPRRSRRPAVGTLTGARSRKMAADREGEDRRP